MTAWKLAYHANCWGGLGGDAVGVTSVTQLAYRTFGDMDRACADIAAAGYAGVELFDGNLLDISKDLVMPVQFPCHVGDDRAQEVEGFTKGCVGKGRVGGTGVGHYDFRVQRSVLRDQRSDLGFGIYGLRIR